MTRLNVGCGSKKLTGYINIDSQPMEDPDLVFDIGTDHWPFNVNSVDFIEASHVLEHIPPAGPFFHVMREMHRVCKPGAEIHVTLPHPRHDIFLQDPTHVHAIMPGTLAMFSKKYSELLATKGWQLTPFWKYFTIDFDLDKITYRFDQSVDQDDPELEWKAKHLSNIIFEWETTLTVAK